MNASKVSYLQFHKQTIHLMSLGYSKVDFGQAVKVTAIAIQGRADVPQWVTTYVLYYSQDDGFYEPYENSKVSMHNYVFEKHLTGGSAIRGTGQTIFIFRFTSNLYGVNISDSLLH